MDGHELYFVPCSGCIAGSKERRVCQIIFQCQFFTAGYFILMNGLFQLREVVKAFLAALTAFIKDGAQHFGNGAILVIGRESLDQGDKFSCCSIVKNLMLQVLFQCLI